MVRDSHGAPPLETRQTHASVGCTGGAGARPSIAASIMMLPRRRCPLLAVIPRTYAGPTVTPPPLPTALHENLVTTTLDNRMRMVLAPPGRPKVTISSLQAPGSRPADRRVKASMEP